MTEKVQPRAKKERFYQEPAPEFWIYAKYFLQISNDNLFSDSLGKRYVYINLPALLGVFEFELNRLYCNLVDKFFLSLCLIFVFLLVFVWNAFLQMNFSNVAR